MRIRQDFNTNANEEFWYYLVDILKIMERHLPGKRRSQGQCLLFLTQKKFLIFSSKNNFEKLFLKFFFKYFRIWISNYSSPSWCFSFFWTLMCLTFLMKLNSFISLFKKMQNFFEEIKSHLKLPFDSKKSLCSFSWIFSLARHQISSF